MDHLFQASIRSALLAAVAGLFNALSLRRVKSASVRHAVWTLVTAGMLLQIVLSPLLPEIPVRVLRSAEPVAIAVSSQSIPIAEPEPGAVLDSRNALSWGQIAAAVYFCGLIFFAARLVFALIFALRLVRASEPAVEGANQSHRISAPLTVGNRILLPLSWSDWDSAKLQSVLAHEEAHVSRRDWAIAAMARLNRCVFWFHPLAWWLERQLARLAEQACDDAALAVVRDREQYARTLLEVARAIQFSRGRVLSAPMAKEANVETRINRILDETRRIPKALGRRGWAALAMFAVPLIYLAAAIQFAPAQTSVMAVPQPAPPPPPPTPGVVTVAQAPAPPAAPAPPQPPAADLPDQQPPQPQDVARQRFEQERRLKDLERRLEVAREAELEAMQAAQAEAQQAQRQGDLDQTTLERSQQFAAFERLRVAETELRDLKAQAQGHAALQLLPQPAAAGSPIEVSVTPVLFQSIAISLDPAVRYDVTGEIRNEAGESAAGFRDRVENRKDAVFRVTLGAGKYSLKILLRNLNDGTLSTRETNFEVK